MQSIIVATAFSGIGSPEMALRLLGYKHEVVFACEIDKFARQSYKANYEIDDDHFHSDVRQVDGTQYKDVDLFVWGFPCQDYSIAGKRAGLEGQRGTLFYEGARITKEMRPKYFIAENVKGLLSLNDGHDFETIMEILRHDVGYHCTYAVLNSKDYGIPQNRERVFIVGFRDDIYNEYISYEYPKPFKLEKRLRDVLEDDVDEKYYLSYSALQYMNRDIGDSRTNWDLGLHYDAEKDVGSALTANMAKGVPYNVLKEPKIIQKSRGFNDGGEHEISPTITINSWQENNHLIEPKIFEHLQPDRINNTLRVGGGSSLTQKHSFDVVQDQYFRIRKLTPRECFRLQGFPDSFKFVCSDSQLYKQAGNSITVDVMMHLIKSIFEPNKDSLF